METKNLISKSLEAPSVSSELSTFKSLKERLNLELTRLNDSLLAIVNISFYDEKIDRLSKIIINKYLNCVININNHCVTTQKTFWVDPNEYINLSADVDLLKSASSSELSTVSDKVSQKIFDDFSSFVKTVINSINEKLSSDNCYPNFSLEKVQVRNFSFDKNSSEGIKMQISFDVDLV